MMPPIKRLVIGFGIIWGLLPIVLRGDPLVFFGQDISPYLPFDLNQVFRPLNLPKSNRAAAEFNAQLSGVLTESFESFQAGQIPTNLSFGSIRVTVTGGQSIGEVKDPLDTSLGGFPISGAKAMVMDPAGSSYLELAFSRPQTAFGFYATDLEMNGLQICLINQNGNSNNLVIPTVMQGTAGAFFFGVIEQTNRFTRVVVSVIGNAEDNVWLDNMIIAMPLQVSEIPRIIRQPQSQNAMAGGNTEFNVVANGTPLLHYQWLEKGNPIPGATNAALVLTQITTDQAGWYRVRIENAAGWVESSSAMLTVLEPGRLIGLVTDAVTGTPLPEVTVLAGDYQTITDLHGRYLFSNMISGFLKADFAADRLSGTAPLRVVFTSQSINDNFKLQGSKSGYLSFINEGIIIFPGITVEKNFAMSPADVAGLRLVLNWKDRPRDMDAHLITPDMGGLAYEVYYVQGHRGNTNGPPYAQLDVDDTDGLGPETITLSRVMPGVYYHFVHNFKDEQGNSGELAGSEALVTIYGEQGLLQTIQAPKQGVGDYWLVCAIDGATRSITVINHITTNSPNTSLANEIIKTPPDSETNQVASMKYLWDFGDGTLSEEETPVKIFENPGIYTVTLVTTSPDGQADAEIKNNYVTVIDGGPYLKVWREGSQVALEWNVSGYDVETSQDIHSGPWILLPSEQVIKKDDHYQLRVLASMKQFFRLKKAE